MESLELVPGHVSDLMDAMCHKWYVYGLYLESSVQFQESKPILRLGVDLSPVSRLNFDIHQI